MTAFTQAQLDALETAMARGVRTVSYNGETVTYASLIEMQKLRALMRQELGAATADTSYFPTLQREV